MLQGRVVLITDLHIKLNQLAMDVNTEANFLKIVDAIKKINMDHLIVAGDLCFQLPELEVYKFVKENLDALNVPYSIITGNHDDPRMISETFQYEKSYDQNNAEIHYVKLIAGRPFIFLDTKKGSVSMNQLEWFKNQLDLNKSKNPIVIMHYPPLFSGVPHMDNNYFLQNKNDVVKILKAYKEPVTIFTGHYHVEKTVTAGNITQIITPSCFVQIDQFHEEFHPDHHNIAYRVIDFDDQVIQTSVHYLWS